MCSQVGSQSCSLRFQQVFQPGLGTQPAAKTLNSCLGAKTHHLIYLDSLPETRSLSQ